MVYEEPKVKHSMLGEKRKTERAIAIAEFICEDGGHLEKEAAKEFNVSEYTIRRELKYLCTMVYYRRFQDRPQKEKYLILLCKKTQQILKNNCGNKKNKKIS